MDDKNSLHPDGHYNTQDADFGIFQPMAEPNVSTSTYPGYAAWTQFSGIPPSPGDAAAFGWDSFVTPPNTPSAGQNLDLNHPNYYSNLNNVMQAMGKSNQTFDANVSSDTDKLASTPVAQSLLEALSSSNPVINPMQDGNIPSMQNPLDFSQTSQDGYDIYAEALKKLGSGYPSYNPFGTSDVLNSSPSATPPPRELDQQGSTKPSFADVAKTLKNNQSSNKERDDSETGKRRSLENTTSRSFKGNKKFVPRPIRGRNNSVPDDMCRTTVSPDSKYGLDEFGDVEVKKNEKEELSSGLDGIPVITRKNSTSSLSSGTSGIEEIHLNKTCNSYCNSSDKPASFEKISNKEKEKGLDKENVKSSKEEKPFFDARRIFQSQTKDTNKRQGQSKIADEDSGPTILNNGKPSYAAWCSSAAHKKSTHYINNNLRDSQKKTNQNPATGLKGQTILPENVYPQSQPKSEKQTRTRQGSAKSRSSTAKNEMSLQTSFDHELIGEFFILIFVVHMYHIILMLGQVVRVVGFKFLSPHC